MRIFARIMCLGVVLLCQKAEGVDMPAGHRGLTLECEVCHTTDSWTVMRDPVPFDHAQTGFPLEDQHRNVDCATCHTNGDFITVRQDCQSCHQDVHRGENGADCQRCHDSRSWIPSQEMDFHQTTRFPLVGVHNIVDCESCHTSQTKNEFVGMSTECYSCHVKDFMEAKSPDHVAGQFDRQCEQCHPVSVPNWKPSTFDHNQTGFALTGAHTNTDCANCHFNGVFAGTPQDCYSCHKLDYEQVKSPDHVAAQLDQNCLTCHTDVAWTPSTFDHNTTGFALTGAHTDMDCAACHSNGVFAGTPQDCYSCHKLDFEEVKNPDHVAAQLDQNCLTCHTDVAWTPSTFDHNMTGFALTGAHTNMDCASCHANGVFAGTPQDCYSCHKLDFEEVKDPDHVAGQFDQDCLACHTDVAWTPSTFDHNQTGFALVGAHTTTDCAACHINGVFEGTPQDCYSCHKMDYEAAKDPDHAIAQFDQNCQTCHTEVAWEPSTFDHNQTGFALTGSHTDADCSSCHVNGVFEGTPKDCYSCHQTEYAQAKDPDHMAARFDTECQTCHTDVAWEPSTFDHNQTQFALTGAHTDADCASCHMNGAFAGTPQDCYSCHKLDYEEVKNPDHVAAQLDQNCLTCHTDAAWKPSTFDHNTTGFTLNGAHATTDCASCHANGVFAGTPQDCYSCHKQDFEQVKSPDHVAGQFDQNCLTCHTEVAWTPATFDHNQTGFALTGAHTTVSCELCHVDGVFAGTPQDCYSCHKLDYERVKDPDHVAGQFDQNCLTCHTDAVWKPSTFDHNQTGFALNGAHAATDCAQCHINGVFAGTSNECIACHQQDYERVDDPNHVLNQFSLMCLDCHTETAWEPATFDHNQTRFPLTGQHANTDCSSCHQNGQYKDTPMDCMSCHQSDFNNTRDPNHRTARFPEDCTLCHNTNRWEPSTFDHRPYFPIYSGAHRGEWDSCATCHTQPSDFKVFSCITCHEHRKSEMDDEHDDVRNYVYESQACYRCHPNGEE